MKKVNFSKEQVSFDAHNLVFVPKQRRRLSAFIRVCAVFAGLLFACLQFADAQPPSDKFSWLNQEGVKYTVSPQTSKGDWILAAARGEADAISGRKNAIVVFRLSSPDYEISPSGISVPDSENVSVVGIREGDEDEDEEPRLYPCADFEIHSVVECRNPNEYYVLCGSIRQALSDVEISTAIPSGLVVILDANLQSVSMRIYHEISVFNSVYAQDSFYYVCGEIHPDYMHPSFKENIVLRGSLFGEPTDATNSMAFIADDNPCSQQWTVDPVEFEAAAANPSAKRVHILGWELDVFTQKYGVYIKDGEKKEILK